MNIFKLIRAFQKAKGRSPTPSELAQLKKQADSIPERGKFLQFPPGGKGRKGPNKIMDELVDEQGNYIGDRVPGMDKEGNFVEDIREFTRKEDLYEGLPSALRNVKNPEEVKKFLKLGAIKIGKAPKTKKTKAPVDPKFKRAVESQEEKARLIKEFERRNKESAFNIAFKRYKDIDKKPMEMDEVISIYTNLNKYPKGRSIIFGDIAEIERGHMLPNIGNRNREMVVNKLNKMVVPKKQPNPFDKASELKEGEQIEMDFTDWDPKGMAGGGLAYMLGEGGSAEDATNFLNRMAPQGERLAYINPKEEKMLKDAGGSGIMTKQGIPSFTEDEEDTGDVSNPGSSGSTGPSNGGGDSGDDDKALSYVNWNQPTRGPGPTRDEGGGNIQSIMNNPFVKAASFAVNPMGTMMGLGARNLYDQYMLDKALQGTSDYGYPSKVKQNVPRENEGNDFTPWWLKQQAPSSLGMAAMKPKDDFDLYGVVEGRTPSRFYADGGRIEFDKGGFNKGRRNFMKLMAGVASLPFVGKFFKAAKPAAKAVKAVEASKASGMPTWFPKLVDKVMKEGKDLGGTVERQIVKEVELPSGTKVMVEHDLTTGDTLVDVGMGKHGFDSGRHGQPARLGLKKGEWIEPEKGKKGIKTKDEFFVEEAEFTGGHPENIKFEESSFEKYGDHASDFSEVEYYATGKNVDKFNLKGTRKAEADDFAQGRAEMEAEQIDEFAKGGIAHMLGE
jgi:hypothetical protein